MTTDRPLLVLSGVADTARVDVLGVDELSRGAMLDAAADWGAPVTLDAGPVVRIDSDPWQAKGLIEAIATATPARVWQWTDRGAGPWERCMRTPRQAITRRLAEIVHVTARGDADEIDLLGPGDVVPTVVHRMQAHPWPLAYSEIPALTGALTIRCGGDADVAASALRHALRGCAIREWSYHHEPDQATS